MGTDVVMTQPVLLLLCRFTETMHGVNCNEYRCASKQEARSYKLRSHDMPSLAVEECQQLCTACEYIMGRCTRILTPSLSAADNRNKPRKSSWFVDCVFRSFFLRGAVNTRTWCYLPYVRGSISGVNFRVAVAASITRGGISIWDTLPLQGLPAGETMLGSEGQVARDNAKKPN